jgi:hypothetical protein
MELSLTKKKSMIKDLMKWRKQLEFFWIKQLNKLCGRSDIMISIAQDQNTEISILLIELN